MSTALQALSSVRINAIMAGLQDNRDLPRQLLFLNRTPVIPATDAEILARMVDRVLIADVIANDQPALVYASGKLNFETYIIPNLKLGSAISQEMINQLHSMAGNAVTVRSPNGEPVNFFENYRNNKIANLLLGVRQRMEALIIGMAIDQAMYDRLGIKFNGTFGMPADLKVVVTTGWDSTSATPVTDVWTLKNIAQRRYGIMYNRMTLSTQAFQYAIATTEFQNKAKPFLNVNLGASPFTVLNISNYMQYLPLAANVFGCEIELYDARYWVQGEDGINFSQPFLPIVDVVLSSTESDNDASVMDFANAVTSESLVSALIPGSMIGGGLDAQFGPIGYATSPNTDLNPPNVTLWGAARGIPRKKYQQATAVLRVGSFVDALPVTEPAIV
jgi:hypothetical protein